MRRVTLLLGMENHAMTPGIATVTAMAMAQVRWLFLELWLGQRLLWYHLAGQWHLDFCDRGFAGAPLRGAQGPDITHYWALAFAVGLSGVPLRRARGRTTPSLCCMHRAMWPGTWCGICFFPDHGGTVDTWGPCH